MCLYTPPSMIRRLILEAEDLTLNPSPAAQENQDFTSASSPADVAADMSSAATPSQPAPGLQGSALTMPSVQSPQATIQKTVINKDIILSQLAELKSIVTNYEKQFESDDLTPEDANVKISGLLSSLVFHAEKFNAFMESAPGGAEVGAAAEEIQPEMPEMAGLEGLPEAAPETANAEADMSPSGEVPPASTEAPLV